MTIAQRLRARGIEEGMEKGREEGIEKGKLEAKIEVAQRMLVEGADIAFIAKLTGLPIQKIKELQE